MRFRWLAFLFLHASLWKQLQWELESKVPHDLLHPKHMLEVGTYVALAAICGYAALWSP